MLAPCTPVATRLKRQHPSAALRAPRARRAVKVRAAAVDGITASPQLSAGVTRNGSHVKTRTVSDSKAAFMHTYVEKFKGPILSPMYLAVMQELLVAAHLNRYSTKYTWDPVTALGVVTVVRQVTDGLPDDQRDALLDSMIIALEQDPKQYSSAAEQLESWASKKAAPEGALIADPQGDEVQQELAKIASAVKDSHFAYSRGFAVGLFRLLECTGSVDPTSLNKLVTSLGFRPQSVTRDLATYRSMLTRMQTAKELQREFIARERRKAEERQAAKAAKSGGPSEGPSADPADEAAKKEKGDIPSSNILRKGTTFSAEDVNQE